MSKRKILCQCTRCKKTIKNIKKGIKDVKKKRVTNVVSVNKFFKDLDKARKAHPVYYFFHDLYYRVKRFIENIPLAIRSFYQRGKRGYSDRDTWALHYFLADIISQAVKHLKDIGHGLPTWRPDMSELEAQNEWDIILNTIIHTFRTAKDISEGNLLYISCEEFDVEKYKQMKKSYDKDSYPRMFRPMSYDEALEFEEGLKVFAKNFFNLDD